MHINNLLLFSHLSHVPLLATPWTTIPLSSTISWSLLKLKSIESVMPSNCLILFHPLLLLPSIFPSIKVFSNKSALHIGWTKNWQYPYLFVQKAFSEVVELPMGKTDPSAKKLTSLRSALANKGCDSGMFLHHFLKFPCGIKLQLPTTQMAS